MNDITTITFKIKKKTRDRAKRTARSLGVPLATVMNSYLERFVSEQEITLSARPTVLPEKLAQWRKISNEMDRGIGMSGPFRTFEELKEHMDRVRAQA
jgi:antitoxin component of RelBE/YafQ-DinJ toxin-antitoxin module